MFSLFGHKKQAFARIFNIGIGEPLRAEILTLQQLGELARSLAQSHQVDLRGGRNTLLNHLDEHAMILEQSYRLIYEANARHERISPAGEWMLDNYYLIEEQIRTGRKHLPRSYSSELPQLTDGSLTGFPRVYAIALELISHADGKVDADYVSHFVSSYQSVVDLKIGELWAVPIMLRLALIENLSRVAVRVAREQIARESAAHWTEKLISAAERSPTDLLIAVADMARSVGTLSKTFIVELAHRLQGATQNLSIALQWLDQRIADDGMSREQLVQEESQSQAADQVSIGNSIGSLRTLQATDWRDFVENQSSVERVLRQDPGYIKSDFATRDDYRHTIETLARRSDKSEAEVASAALELAQNSDAEAPEYEKHVGYYLVDNGLPQLETRIHVQTPFLIELKKSLRCAALPVYLSIFALLTWYLVASHAGPAFQVGTSSTIAALISLILVSSQLTLAIINWASTLNVMPRRLARLDLSGGIPDELRTIVVVPTILSSREGAEELVEKLEIRYLANRDKNLHFALLTDFRDAEAETQPNDDELIAAARVGIEDLNSRYSEHGTHFYLFHRPRQWNEIEQVWMGYERKRGKLEQFNRFLTQGDRAPFSHIIGDTEALKSIKYVITLDTDTQLPRDSARDLIATLAHPLNRPIYDIPTGRVLRGYTILQPTAGTHLPSAHRSWFSRLFSGDPGIDPYTQTVSDVYQDLFGEGSFIGKGIYDLAMFERVLAHRFPENRILSHDLLEGCYVRSGFVSDVLLVEEFPSRYLADVARRHRWIRGDWQIMRWLFPTVPTEKQKHQPNTLSALSRWKIFDNLRRSLVPIATVVALLLSWAVLPNAAAWTVLIIAIYLFPIISSAAGELLCLNSELSCKAQMWTAGQNLLSNSLRQLLSLAFLPYEALESADAILRTLVRLIFTRRRLLQWTTSSESEQSASTSLPDVVRAMWIGPVLGIATATLLAIVRPDTLSTACPILLLWIVGPVAAWRISKPVVERKYEMSGDDWVFLRRAARATWAYFETFVAEPDNWLPPDNFQETPAPKIAHRTSPTNIGMALLANVSAYDLGYITIAKLLERTQKTLNTMQRLERYRGHFYNWYDTQSLRPLMPLYVSTVDSGNLAGHLHVLRQGLLELFNDPIVHSELWQGLRDSFEYYVACSADGEKHPVTHSRLDAIRRAITHSASSDLSYVLSALDEISKLTRESGEAQNKGISAFAAELESVRQQILVVAPWLDNPDIRQWLERSPDASAIRQELLKASLTLKEIAALPEALESQLNSAPEKLSTDLREYVMRGAQQAARLLTDVNTLAELSKEFAEMDFTFLFDQERDLFSIGFNVSDHRLDASFYDLLASEARLTSFVAIAQGQVRQEHWFLLGRQITGVGGAPTLVSWSGSMFEYLMPLLVMPDYENTLLHATYKGVVSRQIEYGRERNVPWGISESGYNITDAQMNYQYRAFGVPGLGLKRGLGDDLVIAPYATVMALMVNTPASIQNLRRLANECRIGTFGFYEAIDYTPYRLPHGADSAPLRSYMAHHSGMSLLSFDYVLNDRPMQRRFLADPSSKANELLLHERIPRSAATITPLAAEAHAARAKEPENAGAYHVVKDPNTPVPEVQLLSNGRYHVMVNAAGAGYSRWKDLAVTRWRADAMTDNFGLFCYLRDLTSNEIWSNSYQPCLKQAQNYEAIYTQGRAEFRRHDNGIDTHTEISIAAEDDVEVRRITLTNQSAHVRELEITTYGEVVINSQAADMAHPAFSKLFVQTSLDPDRSAIYCTRRPRSNKEEPIYFVHALTLRGEEIGAPTFETDRAQFIGRGNTLALPSALQRAELNNSQGPVLDPIVAIRRKVRLQPHGSASLDFICGVAETRDGAENIAQKYSDQRLADRVFEMSWTHTQLLLRQLNASEADAQLFRTLAGSIIYPSYHRRASASILAKNRRGQSGLWGYGISGDLPIMLIRISDPDHLELVRLAVQAHGYWRLRGLSVDLVISNDDASVYRQSLYDHIMSIINASTEAQWLDKPGGIFVRRADQITEEDRTLLQTASRVVLNDSEGTFQEQVERRVRSELYPPRLKPSVIVRPTRRHDVIPAEPKFDSSKLKFFNGIGGFREDGKEYVIVLPQGRTTPAPWCNVIANPFFGTVVSDSGSVYTWLENSHEFRLTPWNNDPVTDDSGEAFYLRDEDTGEFWSPTPLPHRSKSDYVVRHGFGYTHFESQAHGIGTRMSVSVAPDAPVKIVTLTLHNKSQMYRRISAFGYIEWVMGELRSRNQMHVVTEIDASSGALCAHNHFSGDFPDRIAFFDVSESARTMSGDRGEFIGRNGSMGIPAAMSRSRLSGRVGAGLDPCGAIQAQVTLSPNQSRQIVFVLGVGRDKQDVHTLLRRFKHSAGAAEALAAAEAYWNRTLSTVRVKTPDPSVDFLLNGWLLYQTLSCRMWARTGFYQSGGAFGFRDQLQDSMALLHAEPNLLREQLLRAASRQFREGDVQHWWHPPSGRGVRTHFSDDYLWLPYATCRYVIGTGDYSVLDERVQFLEGRAVNDDEEAYYDLPMRHEEMGTLYEHCVRAIRNGMKFGVHGLPLMGCGDWNDGMNRVGEHGKGESVWLAFFLYDVLQKFAIVAREFKDVAFAEECLNHAKTLKQTIEKEAWDGEWYRRAYFDDGTPLGSAVNDECSIDALPQSWAVLSGAGNPDRARMAMKAVNEKLVREDAKLIQLFDPPFDKTPNDPGYIKGYLPGVRENGGQYTHAAIWTVMALAELSETDRAWQLFNMINPINHAPTESEIQRYKVEPYVAAADIYGVDPHTGRGGWTWYTGSAGWMYRLLLETFLGVRREGNKLFINPRLPGAWSEISINYRYGSTHYHIKVENGEGPPSYVADDRETSGDALYLVDDQREHTVRVNFRSRVQQR